MSADEKSALEQTPGVMHVVLRRQGNNQSSIRFKHCNHSTFMPEKKTVERARRKQRQGKAPSTQAGEFVREEIHHVRQGKHGARSTEQAVAIGLSKARRAGFGPPPPNKGSASKRKQTKSGSTGGRGKQNPSPKRSKAGSKTLQNEGRQAASSKALSRHARTAAKKRPAASRSAAARKAARTRSRKR